MNDLIQKYFSDTPANGDYTMSNVFFDPADILEIKQVEKNLDIKLPQDYVNFLLTTNGYDGMIGESYVALKQIRKVE